MLFLVFDYEFNVVSRIIVQGLFIKSPVKYTSWQEKILLYHVKLMLLSVDK